MNTVALLPVDERRALFTETGVRSGLPPFHIEKDFWVCWVLAALFGHGEIGPNLTFRGGTSLAKAWGIIQRFSEDVDLAMARDWPGQAPDAGEKGITRSEKERRFKALRDQCREAIADKLLPVLEAAAKALPELCRLEVEPLDTARDPFCLHFEYPGTGLQPPDDYYKARVKVELSGRADRWPMEDRIIRPYVAEAFPQPTGDPRLTLSCVRPERTFWEKAALVHEQNMRPESRTLRSWQARHLSDLVRLWEANVAGVEGFLPLFEGVKEHRRTYFEYTWVDYEKLKPGDLRLVPPEAKLADWRLDYQSMRTMFFHDPPDFSELVERLRVIEDALARL